MSSSLEGGGVQCDSLRYMPPKKKEFEKEFQFCRAVQNWAVRILSIHFDRQTGKLWTKVITHGIVADSVIFKTMP